MSVEQSIAIALLLSLLLSSAPVYLLIKVYRDNRALKHNLKATRSELDKFKPIININAEIAKLNDEFSRLIAIIEGKRRIYEDLRVRNDAEEMGFYLQFWGELTTDEQYNEALQVVKDAQNELIRQRMVVTSLVDDLPLKSIKVEGIGKLAVNAFNGEAREIFQVVSQDNLEKHIEKLAAAFARINDQVSPLGVKMTQAYLDLKIKEMVVVCDRRRFEEGVGEAKQQPEFTTIRKEEKASS